MMTMRKRRIIRMTTKKRMRRICGLRDLYIAPVTENSEENYATSTPVKLARALTAKISDKFATENLYSDDSLEDAMESYTNTEVEIDINTLSNEEYAMLFETLYDNGFLAKSDGDKAKEIALGFRAKRIDGTYDFSWLYCGKFTERPEDSYESTGEKVNTQKNTLKGTFYSREKKDTVNGKEKHFYELRVNESELVEANTEAKTAITKWFTEVQEYAAHTAEVSG